MKKKTPSFWMASSLEWLLALDDPKQDHDHGNDEQDVYEPVEGVGCDDSKQPKDDQYDRNQF